MKSLTIGLVCPYTFLIPGGVEQHTRNLGKSLSKMGHKVIYFSPDPKNKLLPTPHISIGNNIRIPSPNGSPAEISIAEHNKEQIQEIIKKNKIDILHFQELLSPFSSWSWLKASTTINVATFHAGWENKKNFDNIVRLVTPQINPYLHQSITTSKVATQSNSYFLKHNKIITPAINTDIFSKPTKKPEAYTKPGYHLVFMGRLDERKGAQFIIPALNLLPPKIKNNFTLHIIGEGPKKDEIINLIELHKLSSRVKFHGRLAGYAQSTPYIQHADAFISPATHGEGFGMVLIEALSAGCPVIAGNNSGYKLTLKNYPFQQYIVDPKDAKAFAKSITSLLTNKNHQQKIRDWAKDFVSQFDSMNIAKKHLSVYQKVINRHNQSQIYDKKHKISYYELGDKQKKTYIVLHGHRSDGKRLLSLSLALSKSNHILTPNLPGSGDSPILKDNTINNLAKNTAKWINSLNLTNFSLVGISMGGMVGIRMIKYLKTKPEDIYLYATPTNSSELTLNTVQNALLQLLKEWKYGTKIATKAIESIVSNTLVMRVLYQICYPFMSNGTKNYEIEQWRNQKPKSLVETLHDIITHPLSDEPISRIPTTYIAAEHDTYLNIELVKKNISKILPNIKFVTIKLNTHVPKGPIDVSFFKPFIDAILKKDAQ